MSPEDLVGAGGGRRGPALPTRRCRSPRGSGTQRPIPGRTCHKNPECSPPRAPRDHFLPPGGWGAALPRDPRSPSRSVVSEGGRRVNTPNSDLLRRPRRSRTPTPVPAQLWRPPRRLPGRTAPTQGRNPWLKRPASHHPHPAPHRAGPARGAHALRLASSPAPAAPGLRPRAASCALLAPGRRRVCAARRLTEPPAESASTPPSDPIGHPQRLPTEGCSMGQAEPFAHPLTGWRTHELFPRQ
ncbi:uncharacterized protein DKFZp434B061-like [Lutra lutra]|uniref:uncharacterized protein DKFZp434B061-like n=1 Tax=Lutra lutra TaxID=9657 RepID=UPI001FD50655|nr:uncharacterized protein DKFZp434B061-like [Lutra lutra]